MPFRRLSCLASPDGSGQKEPLSPENGMQVATIPNVEEIPENERGACTVALEKKDGIGLGLTVSGGCDRDTCAKITNMRSSGIAAMSDRLQVGDNIISVNGIRTAKMKHAEIISLLKNAGDVVTFVIEYQLPPTTVRTATVMQKTTSIILKKGGSFGFVLRGGPHEERVKSRPHVITHIRRESAAEKNGVMKTGDRILSINSTNITDMTLPKVMEMLNSTDDHACFTIEYDVSVMDAVSAASGPLLVEVSKTPGNNLGVVLTRSTQRSKHVICIEKIQPASVADRCGALHVGDRILSIDGVAMDGVAVSVVDASKLLQSCSDNVRLEILPASRLAIEAPKYLSLDRFTSTIASTRSMSALNYFPQHPRRHFSNVSMMRDYSTGPRQGRRMQRPKYAGSALSLSSVDHMSGNQVVHTENLQIHLLSADDQCPLGSPGRSYFGIRLQGGVFATEVLTSPPAIVFLEAGSSAERCGRIQVGDRILSINGCGTENESIDEVNRMLCEAWEMGQVYVELEFDVAESVVPSCGTFHVKLPKRGEADLGIVIGASGKAEDAEPLLIMEVKKGSAAHRTGTLQEGDRLLAIDGIKLGKGSTVEDAWSLLQSAEDVIRLKIRKDDDNSDDGENAGAISFNVELKRYGGPLGITISGTEDAFDPIVISGIAPGGLAHRTGAIHKGDQILSINNISLRAKPLSEAISLLQTAGETVNLKIRKQTDNSHRQQAGPEDASPVSRYDIVSEAIDEQSDPEDDPVKRKSTAHSDVLHGHECTGLTPPETQEISGENILQEVSGAYAQADVKGPSSQTLLLRTRKPDSSPVRRSVSSPTRVESLHARFGSGRDSYTNTWNQRRDRGREAHLDPRTRRRVTDWQSALMDLQSVGQVSDIVRDLEESISGEPALLNEVTDHPSSFQPERPTASAGSAALGNPTVQLHKITIEKNHESEDFGFSLSDGQLERGVFVHSTRNTGPAERAGLKPYDRILQINGIRTRDFDCCHAIPLISHGRKRIVVIVARHVPTSSIMSLASPLLTPPVEIPNSSVMHAGPYGTL